MPTSYDLSLHVPITRWIVLQKARRHTTKVLRLLVRTQFQDLFHSPSGVLLTFPSRYLFTIDHKIYLALGGGPPGFSQGFTCPDLLDKRSLSKFIEMNSGKLLCKYKVCDTLYTRLSLSLAQISNCFYSSRNFIEPYVRQW
jgi:hypothetical protein